ncbi:hypothetical protein H1R17_02320 [Flavobacterium sp. xlx-214]|uniref:hypothetical protein n=1 Tax=unclassified Flavobacterium TaxID=196869 RepID=UPI0013D6D8F2|nr:MULTISPECIES: hypothetical protein [unclassified Flavobacterium]MBA5794085.1 hypothetical protein [Flavobacterium sp. xlx-221]QMI83994.1 hypothetical protein H1R17_02320 [Flavobacterium sp. xlx-214]
MNKRVLNISLILLMASTGSVFAQQGFGTNRPAQSAAVDIVSPNKGLLIPRVALQADNLAAPITSPATSLMVYNTTFDAAKNLKQGFYFWNGTKWEPFTTATTDLNTTNVSLAVVGGELILTDSDGHPVKVNTSDLDKQQITTFDYDPNNANNLILSLERGGTKTVNLSKYFNSTKLKDGKNTKVFGNGLTGTEYYVDVETASKTQLGVVQIGSGINVDANGVISVPAAPGETTTTITNTVAGHKIADYKNEANATVAINETVTNLTQNASGISYTKEDGTTASAKVVSANAGNLITTDTTDFGALLTETNVQGAQVKYQVVSGLNTAASLDGTSTPNLQKYKVDVKTGNGTTLGVVKEATTPTVNVTNGELAVNLTNTKLSGEVSGPLNATIVNDDVIDAANLKSNAVTTVKIADANVTPIKIQPAATHTQTQVMVTDVAGTVKWVDQSTISPATTVSNTSTDNTLITTVNGVSSNSVNLVKTVGLNLSADKKLTTTVNGVSNTTALDLSGIDTNTTNKTLAVSGTNLVLTDSDTNTVQVPLTDLDKQTLTYTTSTNKLSISNGNEVDLSSLKDPITTNVLAVSGTGNNTLSSTVNGKLSNTINMVDNVALSLSADKKLTTTVNGVSNATALDLSSIDTNTDNQTLSYDNTTKKLSIVRGNDVDLSALATDTNTITTVSANATQSYVKVTSNPANPGTANRDYAVGVDSATPQIVSQAGTTTPGTSGVVKPGNQFKLETDGHLTVKYAMPQFFYMPSILIDTSVVAPTVDKTVNLYTQYTTQFNVASANKRSSSAPAQIPVIPAATDLHYYVTYSDDTAIEIVSITDAGLMTYRVKSNTNSLSFVNIVFVIK